MTVESRTDDQPGTFTGAYYIGKDFVKKGTRKDKEGKDVEWKMYKLRFKKNMEDQFPIQMSAFNTVADTLEEGEYYNVGYKLSAPTYNDKAKKEIQYKSAFYAKKANPGEVKESTPKKEAPKVDLKAQLDDFRKEYEKLDLNNDCWETFMLTWFSNNHADEYDSVHSFAKPFYEKPKPVAPKPLKVVEASAPAKEPEPKEFEKIERMVVEEEDIDMTGSEHIDETGDD
jgi:hypothetical protein